MQSMVLTVIGKDKVGLINEISACVEECGGNWLKSSFCHLAGQFAGFVEVELSDVHCNKLITQCQQLEDLQITLVPSVPSEVESLKPIHLIVTGNDRKGIVSQITTTLKRFDVNIQEMYTSRESAPNWGNLIFTAKILASCAPAIEAIDLKDAIEQLADDLMVETESQS
ncbi:MAG: ACT domain-containing protein [Pseudomonadota bacterium]